MEAVATVVQQQLAEIGVKLSIEGLDSQTFFNRFFAVWFQSGQETTWDLGSNGWDSERGSGLNQMHGYVNDSRKAWGFSEEAAELAAKINATADEKQAAEDAKVLQKMTLNEELREKYRQAAGRISPSPFAIGALIAAYTKCDDWLEQLNEYLDGNIDWVIHYL